MTVIAYAHRGGADGAPENTMPAFERAVELGYTWLETDVHLTRDGVVVAFHDSALDRVTDRGGRIAELTYAEVAAADAGHWYTLDGGTTYPFRGSGVTVPTLADILNRWPEVRVNIDAKADTSVAPLIRLLGDLDAFSRVCLASFSDRRLTRMRRLARRPVLTSMGVRTLTATYMWSRFGRFPPVLASRVQAPMRAGGVRVVDERFVSAAHRAGLCVDVWTVNSESEMLEALDVGVDGLMSDRLELLKRVLTERGKWENGAAMSSQPLGSR